MKYVKVKSITDCFDYIIDGGSDTLAIISIQKGDDGGYGFRYTKNSRIKGVLTLLFDDIEAPSGSLVLFSEAQAREVIGFIDSMKSLADTLLVHCYAGQSRSLAVGAFAVKYLGADNSAYFLRGVPNQHVYTTLVRVLESKSTM